MLASLFLLVYVLQTVACAVAVLRALRRDLLPAESDGLPISIVVCVHNESIDVLTKSLNSMVRSLGENDELVVVADHVPDDTMHYLQTFSDSISRCRLLISGERGKKAAQKLGVLSAHNECVVCTDADCLVRCECVGAIRMSVSALGETDFLLLLPVLMKADDALFGQMVELEFACLQCVGVGSALLGYPTMANGAGMAFNRRLYLQHNQRHAVYASGDDMFLLEHAIVSGATVLPCLHRGAVMHTSVPPTLRAYLRQRVRWLGKAGGYQTLAVRVLAVVVLLGNVSWLLAFLSSWQLALGLFGLKLLSDMFVCAVGRRLTGGGASLVVCPTLELSYLPMICVVAVGAFFADKRKW